MAQEPMNELVDGMERMGRMTFDDLPDVAIMQIFDRLDIRSRFRMRRVNKRMNEIQPKVKNNLEKIELKFPFGRTGELILTGHGSETVTIGPKDDEALVYDLSRLTVNTHVHEIVLIMFATDWTRERDKVINAFLNMDSDELHIRRSDEVLDNWDMRRFLLTQMNLSIFLPLAKKFERVDSTLWFSSMTAQDLCLIRKMMIEGNCKLKSFYIVISWEMRFDFMEECFGVTIEENYWPDPRSRMFRATDESVELYIGKYSKYNYSLHHFERDIWTLIENCTIEFTKCDGGAKPKKNYEKVKMNHFYSLE